MNMKKLFPESKVSKKGLIEFFDKKGFYIVLVLCILIVGATAVYVTTRNAALPNTNYDAQKIIPEDKGNAAASNIGDKEAIQSASNSKQGATQGKDSTGKTLGESKSPAKNNNATGTSTQKSNKNSATSNNSSAKGNNEAVNQKFIMPVFGENTLSFAKDKLVYSKTLEEWRTHSGIDIAADRGTVVKAAADGVISEIKSDPRLGFTVLIEHPNGLKTVYANLASDDAVSTNQKVKQGEAIGCIGNTANFESAERSHLHFEVLRNDEPIDPTVYLPAK